MPWDVEEIDAKVSGWRKFINRKWWMMNYSEH